METVYTEEYKGYTIKIIPDFDPMNPREWDNLGTMVCWHSRYNLGDEQPRLDAQEWLESMLVLNEDEAEKLYKSATAHIGSRHEYPNLKEAHDAYFRALFECFQKQAVILPLYLYDHSGITMNTAGFHCPWDSGQVGFIYVLLEDVRKEYNVKRVSPKLRRKVEDALRVEVDTYDDYLRGNVYGFEVEKDGEHVESCWGFLGDYEDYCLNEARSTADYAERQALPLLDKAGLLTAQV